MPKSSFSWPISGFRSFPNWMPFGYALLGMHFVTSPPFCWCPVEVCEFSILVRLAYEYGVVFNMQVGKMTFLYIRG